MDFIAGYELQQMQGNYYPLIISINYQEQRQPYALIAYCAFQKDSKQNITGLRCLKQVVLINGLPFEIKSIYGMQQEEGDHAEGEAAMDIKDSGESECSVCLTEEKDTVIMPCGHLCCCGECGKSLVKHKHTCPVCRGHISSLIPIKHK